MVRLARYIIPVFVIIFCACGCNPPARTLPFANALSSDNVPIAYAVYGRTTEPTVVFVHGWCCDSRYWHNQIPYFSKKYRVITIDLAGHGNSGFGRKVYTTEAFGQDVASVLRKLNVKKAILVGHSMGGEVVLYAAKIAPERVIGLVAVDTLEDMGMVYPDEVKNKIYEPIAADFVPEVQKFVRTMFPVNTDKELVDTIARDMSSAPQEVALSSMKEYFKVSDPELIKGLAVPLKSVNADLWPTNVEGNKKLVPSYEMELMKGHGHFIMLEAPDEFNALLEKMINRIIVATNGKK
ncbi:3-oxoadipate enol-lactonase [Candidatus Velamenicoccus archaeovorus]|uniref:3-oxoadipate enol-lactonase n=1 Tax=Velamenicoccus archaeovorus TaxID=1930593 RepID=A0A410P3F0_VELA1|nr:alpha/beta hydrolase [Candidatus Velamenicoccus archaeovorus]QAT16663.1 3-oxoadipate enol-lactonase [Candidatus Velamenicoccus archaeovorus]